MLIPNKFNGYSKDNIRLYHKKGGSAPAPDPRMGEAANRQVALAEQQWADYQSTERPWLQNIANEALGIQRSTAKRANDLSDYQLSNMKRNDERYWGTAVPFEDQLLRDVNRFDSADYKQGQINSAKADVQESFDNAQREGQRGLMRRGVNPASYSFISAANGGDIAKATALASAANKTRMAADQIGMSTKMSMYGGMKGLAGLGNANASLAQGAMGTGLASAGGMTGAGAGMVSANNSSFSTAMGGMSSGISGMGSYANLGLQAQKADNDSFGTLLGAGATVAAAF